MEIGMVVIALVRELLAIYQVHQAGQSTDENALKAFRAAMASAINVADAQIDVELARRKTEKSA